MKFLIYGNSPKAPTGYGVQIAQLATMLKRDGHDVAIACTYGHQINIVNWATPYGDVRLYPSGRAEQSVDVLEAHALHFFEGDPRGGWIIPLTDVWALNVPKAFLDLANFNVLAWTPVDHWPVPPDVLKFFHNTGARPVAMSRFGEQQFIEAGQDPSYAPLAVDTTAYQPTREVVVNGVATDARSLYKIPASAFAVLMVSMNKDPQDRKSFNEAFRAFGAFWKSHQDAVLVVHTNPMGSDGSGINLRELAKHAAIPPHALIFSDAYAQMMGFTPHMMAGLYTACDVLLAPSKGEGFGVPMIEAQACGTPVIASDFTAQSELIGPGWRVEGQLEFDPHQAASYLRPFTQHVLEQLTAAYDELNDYERAEAKAEACIAFAKSYDVEQVWADHWRPILASLEPYTPPADKPLMERVDVLVPLMRAENRHRFWDSFEATKPEGATARTGKPSRTYAQNVNALLEDSDADWVLIVGDDVEFTPGWFEEARKLSDRYDVIGTNDSEPDRVRNTDVAAGRHADHFFVRRSYIDDEGASLDGPGSLMAEVYGHWYTDKELVELAKARKVYGHAHECRIIHHHPGYDGDEDSRQADPIYRKALDTSEADRKAFLKRLPIIQSMAR
jgi:glycosyltransferase involved in cell wall biosynthesis